MPKRVLLFPVVVASLIAACSPSTDGTADVDSDATRREASGATQALNDLFADEWAARLERDPLFASQMGVSDYDDRLPIHSAEDYRRFADEDQAYLGRLEAIDPEQLSDDDRVNYELFDFIVRSRVEEAQYQPWLIPILSDEGFHINVQRMHESMHFDTVDEYRTYIARLTQIGPYFDQEIAHMREGLRVGITQPQAILKNMEPSISGAIVNEASESIFFEPFAHVPGHFSDAEREQLKADGASAIEDVVVPAYRRFFEFFTQEYEPGARETLGASDMPDGNAWYEALVRYYTTLDDATPDAIHELGLKEVKRIRGEMDAIIHAVEFDGTFAEFLEFLRTDPRFYAGTPKDLLKEASYIAKKIDGQLPALFRTLPRLPYGIKPVPADIAPNYTTGRYWDAPVGGRRGGYYMVNTYALDKRPLYELAALTAHEAAPGHHIQTALRQEITGVPDFRRAFYPHAFGEGWGLYSEKLGIELGIYETPYDNFGRLSYEMWRACRLVIDTGIHSQGWTRDQALQYLADNTALSLHNVRTEVDRYISWPGQALAYKMGEIKILELRQRAERELGADFDIRDFHDTVLLSGGVTLNILDRLVNEYIRRTKGEHDRATAG